eukprot:202579-Rhodomonas_salina.1
MSLCTKSCPHAVMRRVARIIRWTPSQTMMFFQRMGCQTPFSSATFVPNPLAVLFAAVPELNPLVAWTDVNQR